jgi:hypothetical protein
MNQTRSEYKGFERRSYYIHLNESRSAAVQAAQTLADHGGSQVRFVNECGILGRAPASPISCG